MGYLQYWKLAHAPFASNSANFFASGTVEEAIARICFLISSRKRLGVLVGPSSVGKTCLLRNLPKNITPAVANHRSRVLYQSLLGLNLDELYSSLARSTSEGMVRNDRNGNKNRSGQMASWLALRDSLAAETAFGTQIVLLLDDISAATEPVLLGIRRILETDTSTACILSVCSDTLSQLPECLLERCQLRVDLPAWDLGQTADYFDFTLSKAMGRPGLFEAQAITRIQELSEGLPQRINRLAELSLVAGATKRVAGKQRIGRSGLRRVFPLAT